MAIPNRPRGIMIDVGANVGLTALPPLKFGLVDYVVALEPSPLNCECLDWTLRANGLRNRCEILQLAAGDRAATVEMAFTRASSRHHLVGEHPDEAVSVGSVQMVPLDDLPLHASAASQPWSFVKIDTQGAEAKVLKGAKNALSARKTLFEIEFWPVAITGLGDNPTDVLEAAETYFRYVIDCKSPQLEIRPIADLREIANRLERCQHTDYLLIP